MSTLRAYKELCELSGLDVSQDVRLAQLTTYRVGGPCDLLVVAHSYPALLHALRTLRSCCVPWVVLGRGSNILASDAGYRGCVVLLGREFSRIAVDGNLVTAGAAVMLTKLVNESLTRELSGLECCAGIPGSVGGAISMDAGSRHEWIGRVVRDVVTLDVRRGMRRYQGNEIEWGYRYTSIPRDQVILEATFELTPSTRAAVADEMNRRMARRRATQPTGRPCCGSVFKNPGDRSVGALLDACGVKGLRVGGAKVAEKHANFVLNEGNATAADVVSVMGQMHDRVQERFGLDLTPEVKFLGFEG